MTGKIKKFVLKCVDGGPALIIVLFKLKEIIAYIKLRDDIIVIATDCFKFFLLFSLFDRILYEQ